MRLKASLAILTCSAANLVAFAAHAQDATTPGTVTTPHPTVENLSIEWAITGDDNENGVVSVRFRAEGDSAWRTGLPLRRVPQGSAEGFSWSNRHAGSLFDLLPGTSYEIELSLVDPDGGDSTQMVTAATRPIPQVPADATERPVTPATIASVIADAAPGDILLLADGTYPELGLQASGTASQPIVIRAENRGAAIIDSEVSLIGRSHVFLEGLTINGRVRLNDTVGMVVRECTINTTGSGIVAQGDGTEDSYFCDNRVIGSTPFEDAALGANGDNVGEGIQVAGPGTVICYNYVRGFRDAISTMEDSEAIDQFSIDIYNNDIEVGADDAIEADFTMGNVRVMRNRIRNSFVGISGQPTLGGPSYFIRNVMLNVVYSPFKLHRGSVGDVAFHNTVVKSGDAFACYAGVTWSQALFRNNLFIGGTGGGTYGGYGNGSGNVAQLADADDTCDFDFDGYGSIGTGSFAGRIGDARFDGLAELQSLTTEAHAVEVDMSVFAAAVTFPASGPFPELTNDDLRIADGSAAVDQGTPLANVNDGFAGTAPDLGAYEAGSLLPHYGPRWDGPAAECGNGVREGTEACDDGNQASGDGCTATCELEATGSGGAGGTGNPPDCTGGLTACSGTCVDTTSADDHCGGCGNACAARMTCVDSSCECDTEYTECDGSCVDPATDPAHCGDCDVACDTNENCEAGVCTCAGSLTSCDGSCVDTNSSATHCGECGNACEAPLVCSGGACEDSCTDRETQCGQDCVDTSSSVTHCGACDAACAPEHATGVCASSACAVEACHDGYVDLDEDPANGCEYACVPDGDETCNDLDDDCDGVADEGLSCAPTGTGNGGASGNDRGSADDSGCGCRIAAPVDAALGWPLLLAAALLARRRRSPRVSARGGDRGSR
jgi:hypothetical protein